MLPRKMPTRMMLLTLLVILMTWMTCCVGIADDKPPRPTEYRTQPLGRVITHEGVDYKAFTLNEWKQWGHLKLDYSLLWDYSLSLELEIASFERDIRSWQLRIDVWKTTAENERSRGDMLSSMFDEEHKLRLKIQRQQQMLGWVPWAIVVVESIAIGVLGVYSGAKLAATAN